MQALDTNLSSASVVPSRKPKERIDGKKHAMEQIVGKFREAKVEPGKGLTVGKMCRKWA